MSLPDVTWALGRPTIGAAATLASRLKVYGKDRVPLDGGLVVASNHFSWLDPALVDPALLDCEPHDGAVSEDRLHLLGKLPRLLERTVCLHRGGPDDSAEAGGAQEPA